MSSEEEILEILNDDGKVELILTTSNMAELINDLKNLRIKVLGSVECILPSVTVEVSKNQFKKLKLLESIDNIFVNHSASIC